MEVKAFPHFGSSASPCRMFSLPFGSSKVPSTAPLLAPSHGPASPYSDPPKSQPNGAVGMAQGGGAHFWPREAAWEAPWSVLFTTTPHPAHNQESKGGSSLSRPLAPYSAQGAEERDFSCSLLRRQHLLPHACLRGWPSPHPHRLEGLPKVTPSAHLPCLRIPSPLLSSVSLPPTEAGRLTAAPVDLGWWLGAH